MDCSICCESFNKTSRKQANCRFCDLAFCTECQKRFLLGSFTEPACMGCKKGYTREHLNEMLPKTFLDSDLKKHRENILYEREKCMLPETQNRLEVESEIRKLETEMSEMKLRVAQLKYGVMTNTIAKKEFTRKCPGGDCQGFLSRDFKCGLCEIQVCKECHEIKEKGKENAHECNKDNVETVKLLAKDSKPCPACSVVIFKISGCSQMWCTSCHTAFDWQSGRIEKGVIHNPHYYEYQRTTNGGVAPRNPGDVPCGENAINEHHAFYSWMRLEKTKNAQLTEILRIIYHIRGVELPKYAVSQNEDIRRKYLQNIINEEKFKWLLQRREKKNTINTEIRHVLDMFLNCSMDIMRKTVLEQPAQANRRFQVRQYNCVELEVIESALTELSGLISYTNESFQKIANIYGTTTPFLMLDTYGLSIGHQTSNKKVKRTAVENSTV